MFHFFLFVARVHPADIFWPHCRVTIQPSPATTGVTHTKEESEP